MISKKDSNAARIKRHYRVRKNISGTPACPRLNVFRSNKGIYAQVIDDTTGTTLVSASSLDKEIKEKVNYGGNKEAAKTIIEYQGLSTCKAAKQLFGGLNACTHGCLGLGDCEAACPYGAIKVCNGVAVVDREACVGSGKFLKRLLVIDYNYTRNKIKQRTYKKRSPLMLLMVYFFSYVGNVLYSVFTYYIWKVFF